MQPTTPIGPQTGSFAPRSLVRLQPRTLDPETWSDLHHYFVPPKDTPSEPFGYDDYIFDVACDWEPLLEEGPTLLGLPIDDWLAEAPPRVIVWAHPGP